MDNRDKTPIKEKIAYIQNNSKWMPKPIREDENFLYYYDLENKLKKVNKTYTPR